MSSRKNNVVMFDAAFPPPIIGGKEKQAYLLSNELNKINNRICALSYCFDNSTEDEKSGFPIYRVNKGFLSILSFFIRLINLRFSYNILHIHTPSRIGKLMAMLGKVLGYKIIFKFPNEGILENLNTTDKILWKIILNIANILVVLEKSTKKILLSHGVNERNIFLVPNGVEVRKKININIKNKNLTLVFVGRLVKQKLCDQLIEACRLLRSRRLSFNLKIIGDGPLKDKLIKLTKDLDLESNVSFLGHQANIHSYLINSDIFVLPSEKEGMSNSLLEAMACGLPIVSTNVGSAEFQMGQYAKKYMCEPFNPTCLADKLDSLIKDSKERANYSDYIYNRCKTIFSINAIARKYESMYRTHLNS